MEESPFIKPSGSSTTNYRDNVVSYFTDYKKTLNRTKLTEWLSNYVVNKIMSIPIRISILS